MLVDSQGNAVVAPIIVDDVQYPPNIEALWSADELAEIGLFAQEPQPIVVEPVVVEEVPLWAARAVLKRMGLFSAINAYIESEKDAHPEYWEAWNTGNVVKRSSALVQLLAGDFQIPAEQITAMFEEANALNV